MKSNRTANTTSRTVTKPDGSKSQLYFEPVEWGLIDKAAADAGKPTMQWCADLIRDSWNSGVEPKQSMTRIVRQAAINANHSKEKVVYPIVDEGVQELTLAIKLYNESVEASGIHPNRMPGWSELDSKSKVEWLDKAHAALTPKRATMAVGAALMLAIECGKHITRESWNAGGQFVFVMANSVEGGYVFSGNPDVHPTAPVFALKNAQGIVQPGWVPSQGDLFATDWILA